MRSLILTAIALLLASCSTPGAVRTSPSIDGPQGPQAGDVLVAVSTRDGSAILAVRRSERAEERVRAHQIAELGGPVSRLRASGDGRWLAVALGGDADRVELWSLERPARSEPEWSSPTGCAAPTFDPGVRWLAMGCAADASGPASILRLDLRSRKLLRLVGERDRLAPSAGTDGDLHWVEEREDGFVVVRRSADGLPFATHELVRAVAELWPQADGSILAEARAPGDRREFVRLLPSGVVRDIHLPAHGTHQPSRSAALHVSPDGTWLLGRCERGPCTVVEVDPRGEPSPPLNLGLSPTALFRLPGAPGRQPHSEDLGTAPATVLTSHPSSQVSVLGIALGTPLETAFSLLDRAGRHPYWMEPLHGRERPAGVGVGWTTDGHCVEYRADDRGLVAAIDLRGCAARYLSPPLRPLLDRDLLAEGAVTVARRFLGPGVVMTAGAREGERIGEAPSIRRTEVTYEAPERGYHYEARGDVLATERRRLLDGEIRLRLRPPGRRQAAAP